MQAVDLTNGKMRPVEIGRLGVSRLPMILMVLCRKHRLAVVFFILKSKSPQSAADSPWYHLKNADCTTFLKSGSEPPSFVPLFQTNMSLCGVCSSVNISKLCSFLVDRRPLVYSKMPTNGPTI